MIELPLGVTPNAATPMLLDFGGILRPATGAKIIRINRAGSRYRVAMTLPVASADAARVIVARLLAARSEGLRVAYPLQRVDQGTPGQFVVDGGGQSGSVISLRGGTPNYSAKEGFWLTIYNAVGQGYLHNVHAPAMTDASGKIILSVTPNLRFPFPNGAPVNLGKPTIEGLVDSDISWGLAVGGLLDGLAFTIEEAE